ncbi:MAG: RDD family protein [Thermoanaerobaculum sp.]
MAGYLIDVIPAAFLGLSGLIPIVGPMIAGLLLTPYWLFRDVTGRSLGKLAVGTEVVRREGDLAPTWARILRNLPIALGTMLLIIPLLGYVLAPPVLSLVIVAEGIMVLTTGERIGDRIAGTRVVRRVEKKD